MKTLWFTLFLCFACGSVADSPVWKISKNGKHIYLGGTFHLLAKEDYPLPASFDKAYKDATTLIFETDINALQTTKYQMQLLNAMTISDGSTLKNKLKPETYAKLQAFFKERNIPEASFLYFTPTGAGLTIAVMEYQRIGMDPQLGVDQHYSNRALQDKKTLGQLNTPEEQISFIANLGEGKEDAMILQTLQDIEKLKSTTTELKKAWRKGEVKKLDKTYLAPIKKQFPDVYEALFVKRNNAWIPKIEELLQDADVEFVLVGAVHMAGDKGLLRQLKNAGYKIENL